MRTTASAIINLGAIIGVAVGVAGGGAGCGSDDGPGGSGLVSGPTDFGSITVAGTALTAKLYTLTNKNGLIAKLTDFGATLVELHVPDKNGVMADIVQGFDTAAGYSASQFAGATVGRVGNRIANASFELDGMTYTVTKGATDTHSLHGGTVGWDKNIWAAAARMTDAGPEITFTLTSADGDQGFPGAVMAKSVYTLTNANELKIVMTATTSEPTPINMLHHSYFNLGGVGSGTVYNHELQLFADQYTPAAASGVPDGMLAAVAGTPFDFTTAHAIGRDATMAGVGDQMPPGYDHNWVVRGTSNQLRDVARVKDPASGRVMTIQADQPGVQFYTTNFRPDPASATYATDRTVGKAGKEYKIHEALALETQKHPNAINFPASVTPGREDTIVRPDMAETYTHTMVHKLTAE